MHALSTLGLQTSILAALLCNACASTYNLKSDYAQSEAALKEGLPTIAMETLPEKAKGTFIDIMEHTYLSLLAGNPKIDELFQYSKKIDNQIQ